MIAALDIGGTKIAAGLVAADGTVLATKQCPTHSHLGFADGFGRMVSMLEAFEAFDGIGIGCTGPIDPQSGVICEPELLRGWWNIPIVERLACRFRVPVAMENDADAVALSEARWGKGSGAECLVYITVGTGIGAGIVRNGELYRGARGGHPEIGHMAIDLGAGHKCYCGLTGCWESLASGPALEAWYGGDAPGPAIMQRAREGEPRAQAAVDRLSRYLAIGLVNVTTAFCPDVILLGGGVLRDAMLLPDSLRSTVRELATQVNTANLRIDVVDYEKEAGLQGAAAVWWHRYGRKT